MRRVNIIPMAGEGIRFVNKGYKLIYNKKRFIKIDASKPINQIHNEIINYIKSLL